MKNITMIAGSGAKTERARLSRAKLSGTRLAWAILAWVMLTVANVATPVDAQSPAVQALAGASLEDLMKIEVTSVSKKEQALSKTGAAVFVIIQEDIRRSGASSIPDVLRMAPGVEVAQINANQWAISIRGFNAVYSDKVLVLIDGRSIYSDSFSGVIWDEVDTPLENIERIEVIRGPGGTVWGANAVNGVINIITKSAADTKGGTVVAGSGSRQTAGEMAQYGGDAGSQGAYRVFGKYLNDDNSPLPGGLTAADGWHTMHLGGRSDWGLASGDTVSLQGDFLTSAGGETSQIVTGYPPAEATLNSRIMTRTGDILARWRHILANGSSTSLQVSGDTVARTSDGDRLSEHHLDAEFEHHFALGTRQDIVWGLDYHFTHQLFSDFTGYGLVASPTFRSASLFAAFVQDEIRLTNTISLTLGTKIEHNAYTGLDLEPSVQLVWNKSANQTLWASAGRAIREPDTLEHEMTYNFGTTPAPGFGTALLVLGGNPHLLTEELTDYEAGYRTQLNPRVSLDATGFLSFYRHLVTVDAGTPYVSADQYGANQNEPGQNGPVLIVPLTFENLAQGRDYGVEFFGNWQATNRWKISPGFTLLRMSITGDSGGGNSITYQTPGDSPRQQFEIRSRLNLRSNLEWDASVQYVDTLEGLNIPAYARLDMRLGWHFGEHTEFSLSGQNLTSGGHFEFADRSGFLTPSLIARSISAKLTLRF